MKSIYLVAYYFEKPSSNRVRTSRAGWMREAGSTSYDEQVAVTRNLKNRDITMSKVILDLANKKVIRNSWNHQSDFDSLFRYFSSNYPKHTKEIMVQIDPDYYFSVFPEQLPKDFKQKTVYTEFDFTPPSEVRVVDTASEVK